MITKAVKPGRRGNMKDGVERGRFYEEEFYQEQFFNSNKYYRNLSIVKAVYSLYSFATRNRIVELWSMHMVNFKRYCQMMYYNGCKQCIFCRQYIGI